jgi:serine/threonine-protein kinase
MKHVVVVSFLVLLGGAAQTAFAAEDPREVEGRTLFARGDFDRSLDVFSKLFAETGEPVYLRNIGRCYQMLSKPDRAITAFREYLRRGKSLSSEERTEVEGFIREMEALKAKQAPPQAPAPASTSATGPGPAVSMTPSPAPPVASVEVTTPAVDPAAQRRRWLRIGGIGAGAAGVVGLGTALYFGLRARSLDEKVTNAGKFQLPDDRAGRSAVTAQYLFYGVGAAALLGGAVLYYFGMDRTERVAIVPSLTPNGAGAVVRVGL